LVAIYQCKPRDLFIKEKVEMSLISFCSN